MPSVFRQSAATRPRKRTLALFGLVSCAVAAIVIGFAIDRDALARSLTSMRQDPTGVALALAAFATAFVLRAVAWQSVLPNLRFGQSLAGIHLSLGANHVLPLRLGEPFRVVSVVRRERLPFEATAASTLTLRVADMIAVVGLGWLIAPKSFSRLVGPWGWLIVGVVAVAGAFSWRWMSKVRLRDRAAMNRPRPVALVLTVGAWLFEAVVIWQSAAWAGIELSPVDAVLVTTVAVAAQVVAIAPSGFGTYEAASVAAYAVLGHETDAGLVAAVTAHGLKTVYSLVAGAIAVVAPQPSMLGRLRLQREAPLPVRGSIIDPGPMAPVLLFMPALNEEAAVGNCIARTPSTVCGRPVHVLVIDDGSTDQTATVARAAGAEVISFPHCRGLGAGVRYGLHHGAEMGAAAVAFCDADEEYSPEELENLVAPVLNGEADYVIGSRFAGTIEHMRPHRRAGNVALTKALSFVSRRRISDGQSGYRAFSPAAAADAEVIHDFNYAQVLTLDLLAKGYRYHEVPISYRFRTSGDSFIKLGGYLRRVVPAIYAEMNAEPGELVGVSPRQRFR